MSRVFEAALFVWAGLLLGVAFVATPAKFLAPSLPLAQALDVGRWTFHVLSIIEWSLVATFVAIVVVWRGVIATHWVALLMCLLAIAAALALQTFAVRPLLDVRVLQIMRGDRVPPSALHSVYIGLEALKLLLLLTAAALSAFSEKNAARCSCAAGDAICVDPLRLTWVNARDARWLLKGPFCNCATADGLTWRDPAYHQTTA